MYYLIVNPVSGSGAALKAEERVSAYLKERGVDFTVLRTEEPGHAAVLAGDVASRHDCRAVLAVGGDGLAYEVACGLAGTEVPLGIIPGGTGNDFIKTTGTPKDPVEAVKFILEHEPKPTDFGIMNNGHFLNVCGTGFDVTVLEETERFKKHMNGLLPYLLGLIRAIFRYRPVHVKLQLDDEAVERDVLVCSVANGRYIGGGIPICPAANLDDGLLDVVLVDNVRRGRIPKYLIGLMTGKILTFDVTQHRLCRHVVIEAQGMKVNCDGEIIPVDRVEFGVLPGRLLLFRP